MWSTAFNFRPINGCVLIALAFAVCAATSEEDRIRTPLEEVGYPGPEDYNLPKNHPSGKLLPIGNCGQDSGDARLIYRGGETELGKFPWVALLKYQENITDAYHCGGTLINDRYIITAAHCKEGPNNRLIAARIGEHNISTDPDCRQIKFSKPPQSFCALPVQEILVEEFIDHPQYNSNGNRDNDIALVRLQKPVQLNDYVQPICLPFGKVAEQDLMNKILYAACWGIPELSTSGSDVKLESILRVPSYDQCASEFRKQNITVDYATQLCAGGKKDTSSDGDSGGPLMWFSLEKSSWYLFGVASYGRKFRGSPGWPGVYTRVSTYMDWILEEIRE